MKDDWSWFWCRKGLWLGARVLVFVDLTDVEIWQSVQVSLESPRNSRALMLTDISHAEKENKSLISYQFLKFTCAFCLSQTDFHKTSRFQLIKTMFKSFLRFVRFISSMQVEARQRLLRG